MGLCSYFVRLLPIPFGIHTIVYLVLQFLLLTIVGKGELSLSIFASLLSFFALTTFEYIDLTLFMKIFDISAETLISNPVIYMVAGEPQVLFLLISAFLLHKLNVKRGRKNEFIRNEHDNHGANDQRPGL